MRERAAVYGGVVDGRAAAGAAAGGSVRASCRSTAAGASMIRVLLVDDQALLRSGFRMVLDAHDGIEVVGEAGDGEQAVRADRRAAPDVVAHGRADAGHGRRRGDRRDRAERHPSSKVLILTTFDLDEYAFAGLRAGASGFLLKDVPPAELVAAIRSVATGDAVVAPRVTRLLLERFAGRLPAPAATRTRRTDRLERCSPSASATCSARSRPG